MRILGLLFGVTLAAAGCGVEYGYGVDDGEGLPDETAAVDTLESAATACAGGPVVRGIDVSEWQGHINWRKVRRSGKRFGIARVSHGVDRDPTFERNWRAMKRVGMVRGAYQYFLPRQSIKAQARIMIEAVGRLKKGDLPATLDVEETQGVSRAKMRRRIRRWVELVTRGTGRRPLIYTGKYFWEDEVGGGRLGTRLWLAQWGTPCPTLPAAWRSWTFHQYSATGRVPGIEGDVDLDRFNGSLAKLKKLATPPERR